MKICGTTKARGLCSAPFIRHSNQSSGGMNAFLAVQLSCALDKLLCNRFFLPIYLILMIGLGVVQVFIPMNPEFGRIFCASVMGLYMQCGLTVIRTLYSCDFVDVISGSMVSRFSMFDKRTHARTSAPMPGCTHA